MEMTMRRLRHNKKGLIFALDGALAVTVVVLMVINSTYYFSLAGKSSLSHLQSVKIGDDIITMMDYLGHLDNTVLNNSAMPAGNTFEISDQLLNISEFLPANYNMWVSVSDLKESIVSFCSPPNSSPLVTTLTLERPMNATMQVNVTLGTGITQVLLTISVNGGVSKRKRVTSSGIYVLGPFSFTKGQNSVQFGVSTNNVCVEWFSVSGSEAYAGSTNEAIVFPTDRFIGAGERIFTVKKNWDLHAGENPVEGTHIARYKIWLKGGT